QVRVRGRGTGQQPSGSVPGDPPGAEPTMAEQLGAVGRPGGDAGPDWSQTARSASAPAWATSEDPPGEGSPSSDAAPSSPAAASADPASADPAVPGSTPAA